jgi:hypothetical protein
MMILRATCIVIVLPPSTLLWVSMCLAYESYPWKPFHQKRLCPLYTGEQSAIQLKMQTAGRKIGFGQPDQVLFQPCEVTFLFSFFNERFLR